MRRTYVGLVCAIAGTACAVDNGDGGGDAEGGELTIAITQAPADGYCIRVTVDGSRLVQREVALQPGQSTVFTLNGLPTGPALVSGETYGVSCDLLTEQHVAGWTADPVGVTLSPQGSSVTLHMRRSASLNLAVDYEEDVCLSDGSVCVRDGQCCSLSCDATGACAQPAGCAAGETSCGGACVDLFSDASNCGACGAACPAPGPSCSDGICVQNCTAEVCDSLDSDCDGQIDEDLGSTTCGSGACERTVSSCIGGQEQTCQPGSPNPEVCGNGIDDDCDGSVDQGC